MMTDFKSATLQRLDHRGMGTLRNHENNSTLLREIDNDRRTTLRDVRYGTNTSYMSEHHSGTVYIRVSVQDLKVQKCLQFELDETVWEAKQRILSIFAKDLKDALNYGLYMPPMNGRAGKFLDEERMLREYPLHGPIGFIEFKYKRRVYKVIHLNPRKLKQLHNKANFRHFIESVRGGNLSKINKLTNKGLDPNFHDSSGETPLSYAVELPKDKCREMIITLVSGGGHIDFRTRQGQTPMHKAVLSGNQTAVKTLLDLGASTNYKDGKGLTPLYYSVLYGKNAACAEMLLHERAMIGTQDEQGWYEIHQACKLGLVQHLEHLMFYGADLDVTNASGNTALHICAVNNNEQCARILLFRGANKHIANYNNQTPQQVAIIAGNVSLAELIKNFDESDVVLYREMPTFSSRRPRASMYASTTSLISRSRSDPKLNMVGVVDDGNVASQPSSMRSLPQQYQMYSDSGSYSASRGSDSPRSMSISSNSSGPGSTGTLKEVPERREILVESQIDPRVLRRSNTHAADFVRKTNFDIDRIVPAMNTQTFQQELEQIIHKRDDSGATCSFLSTDGQSLQDDLSDLGYDSENFYREQAQFIYEKGSNKRNTIQESYEFSNFDEIENQDRLAEDSMLVDTLSDISHGDAAEFAGQILQPSVLDRKFVCVEAYEPSHPLELRLNVGDIVQVASVTDTGFWEGTVHDREGWFPAHHVQEVRLRNKAGSLGDLLAEESRESTLMHNRNTLATLVRSDNSDYGPRTVVLQRAPEGYGFVLRGAKSQLKPNGELDFRPSAEFPALQYLDSVDPGSVSDRAGLRAGDFILEINGENVVRASHDRVVHLIRSTGDTLAMKVVTVKTGHHGQDWFHHPDRSMTMPNRQKKKAAPTPPTRNPHTSLSMTKTEAQAVSEEMAAMEKLDLAISGSKEDEKKTASIRSRTAAKRVSVVELDNIDMDGKLERAKSTPDLLDRNSKARKDIIYATPTVPDKKSNVYAVPGVNSTSTAAKVPPSPQGVASRPKSSPPPPPADSSSPKKQAPKPPMNDSVDSSTSSEIVTINTGKQSPYASAKILVKSTRKSESPYESSFRPGDSARMTEEPKETVKTHQRTTSAGATVVKHSSNDTDKQNVSFADDKVVDHAAKFLKKHPNAKLLITAKGQESLRNRTSMMFEPEPDYDSDSGEDKPQSPVKLRDPKRQSVTVISVGEQKQTQAQSQTSKRYTIHSSIPSEDKQSGFVIPPRPEGRAPSPPKPQSPQHGKPKAAPLPPKNTVTVKADINIQSRTHTSAPPLPTSEPPALPKTPPPDFDETPSPSLAPPPAPAPPPIGGPPPPPPPPPPVPTNDEIVKAKTTVKADYIGNAVIKQDAIAAAVAKRQERMQNEGPRMGQQKTKPPPAVDTNQAAIIAAVQKRKQQLENQDESSVLDAIESRLQKTKKLQAAKFSLAGSKAAVTKKDSDEKTNGVSGSSKAGVSVQSSVKNPVTKTEPVKAEKEEFSFKVEPVKFPKQQTGLTEIKPKFASKPTKTSVNGDINKTNFVQSANLKTNDSVIVKTQPLDKNADSKVESNKKDSEQEKNEKNLNGQSDFLALAEKKRQEWLSRKQKSTESKSSTSSTPEKTNPVTNNNKVSPPVSAKPSSPKAGPVKAKPLSSMNGDIVAPPPPGFRDGGNNNVIQLEIIPPPANFSSDSGVESGHQHSPAFSPDTASLVSSLSTLSSLSGEGRANGYDDVIAPPPPGFDDNDSSVIPPPPEFGNKSKTYNDKVIEQWLCNDVLDWLDSLSMSQYKTNFQRQCIDGKKLLGLTRNSYIDLGVTQVAHRMSIERAIKKAELKQKNNANDIIASEHL